jgi:hypothetical protein
MTPSAVLLDLMVQPSLERLGHSALPDAPVLETPVRRPRLAGALAAIRRRLTLPGDAKRPVPALATPPARQI